MSRSPRSAEEQRIVTVIARMRAGIMAIVFGMLGGTGLLVATLWLVVQNGPDVGQHLSLLRHYFPGYRVSWLGAPVGFLYGALVGGVAGGTLALVYNRIADMRQGGATAGR